MKITKTQLRQIIKEELKEAYKDLGTQPDEAWLEELRQQGYVRTKLGSPEEAPLLRQINKLHPSYKTSARDIAQALRLSKYR